MNVQIRNMAADTLFLHVSAEDMITCNWAKPTAELKPAVRTLRKSLKIA